MEVVIPPRVQAVLPMALEFEPDLVLVSAGFDALAGDPKGGMSVSPAWFARAAALLSSLASGRLLAVLEGGYNCAQLSLALQDLVAVLSGLPTPPLPPLKPVKTRKLPLRDLTEWTTRKMDHRPTRALSKTVAERRGCCLPSRRYRRIVIFQSVLRGNELQDGANAAERD